MKMPLFLLFPHFNISYHILYYLSLSFLPNPLLHIIPIHTPLTTINPILPYLHYPPYITLPYITLTTHCRYTMDEYATARRTAIVRGFIDALTRGGYPPPPCYPRPCHCYVTVLPYI